MVKRFGKKISIKKFIKKIYKNLSFAIYKNIIYVSDNIGFIYAINLDNGKTSLDKKSWCSLKIKNQSSK